MSQYYMEPVSGAVMTAEEWQDEYEYVRQRGELEDLGYGETWDELLVKVVRDADGEWVEAE